jgi:hypothetical protein
MALNNPQIEDLKSMKPVEFLASLMRQWLDANFSFPSYCGYEKRPTDGMILVSMGSFVQEGSTPLMPIMWEL